MCVCVCECVFLFLPLEFWILFFKFIIFSAVCTVKRKGLFSPPGTEFSREPPPRLAAEVMAAVWELEGPKGKVEPKVEVPPPPHNLF